MPLARAVVERLIFGPPESRRYTQDSPILPDVWIRFAETPGERLGLLLTPHRQTGPGELARTLRAALETDRERRGLAEEERGAAVAHLQSYVRAELDLADLLRVALPMTPWWNDYVWTLGLSRGLSIADWIEGGALRIASALDLLDSPILPPAPKGRPELGRDLLWTVRIAGALAWSASRSRVETKPPTSKQVVAALAETLAGLPPPAERRASLWLVNRDRPVYAALHRSVPAVKGDAAQRLFQIDCSKLRWAVVDGGIDRRHPAFLADDGKTNRVIETWDLTRVRWLLDPNARPKDVPPEHAERLAGVPREVKKRIRQRLLEGGEIDWDLLKPILQVPHDAGYVPPESDHGTHVAGILGGAWRRGDGAARDDAGGKAPKDLVGMCADIRLYDFRVFSPQGPNDEFGVLAALQLIRHLNRHADSRMVHGANLSLSLLHDVANYACGRTPVCEECERLVASGVVVVAAAGNSGYLRYLTEQGPREGYHTVSITDPGNADGVITVGATHRFRPHTYGVSYFSSRGPTGDGRRKPDLVAPGEKVLAPVGHDAEGRKDGTSMAAPHVSGAAAMLMARHSELEGDPAKVKQVLCRTATDLGREPYFQGAGMLDVLRALQSI